MKVAVVGAGWAGLACAVAAVSAGHAVTVFEAGRTAGGRARTVNGTPPLDNGQHILIGAYTDTLALMRTVGADPDALLLRLPLTLRFPDGGGIALPRWPAPLDLLAGIATARGWSWADRWSLLRAALRWRWAGFRCAPEATVADLCAGIARRPMEDLIDPLCVSALNTPADEASGAVFLRVLHDALFAAPRGGDLLLPRADLGALLPEPAQRWLAARRAAVLTGHRVQTVVADGAGWQVDGVAFARVVLACPPGEAARLARATGDPAAAAWADRADALRFEAIATVYATALRGLAEPMLALRSTDATQAPAQFVFDRGRLGGPAGLLAFVVSASRLPRADIEAGVVRQAADALGTEIRVVQTIVEKRATFACTPGLARPGLHIAPGLLACGDYLDGPYPATLEGAVRSGRQAAAAICS
ncbi:hydroxysqualene dehydroxylase HpnE [uncultured Xylophilus sp.]|uniref:hydroxysqualene dehydroxylase HpnE n=1 Tax=uncultured Xylophilus sp. TaxID=296832 RepID=UPI0025CCADC8|nr:hydroxysqualene dehydroxylase HpnE [uncultured Xylophilus sp.]